MKKKWTSEEVRSWYQKTGCYVYWNPNDANLVVKKRNNQGWMLNWGNAKAYLVIATIWACVGGILALFIR